MLERLLDFVSQNLDQWSLRKSWLELQLMIKQASKEVLEYFQSIPVDFPASGVHLTLQSTILKTGIYV